MTGRATPKDCQVESFAGLIRPLVRTRTVLLVVARYAAMSGQMRKIVVTGSASGMGAATFARLEADGHRVIGIDLHDAEVTQDLSTAGGRSGAIDDVVRIAGDSIDGLVTWAGVAGLSDVPGSLLASVNYFGTVELLDGLRPLLAKGEAPAAIAVSSNSTTCQPGIPLHLVDQCLSGDEAAARDGRRVGSSGDISGHEARSRAMGST